MKRKLIAFSIVTSMLLVCGGLNVSAEESSNITYTAEQLQEIEQAKKETLELQKTLESGSQKDVVGDIKLKKEGKVKDLEISVTAAAATPASTRKGVFYVTSDATSSNSSAWAGGHAGMVYNEYYTMEAWGNQGAALNGVNLWPNNWKTKYNHFMSRSVSGTTITQDAKAGDKAYSYTGLKPYNFNFFSIDQDDSFYCSQLVWYAYKKTLGIDLNDGGAVWPVDLSQTTKAYTLYSQ